MNAIINKSSSGRAAISVSGVGFAYRGTAVFQDLSLSIRPGVMTALVGPNGSGKSTLLSLLAGVLRPDVGTVSAGTDHIAFAVQRSAVTDTFPVTVAEAVMMGRWRRLGLLRRPTSGDRAVVEHWLLELGLADLRRFTLGELSGGQRQRVLLAQALAQEAPLLLLDEPTTGLDAATTELLLDRLHGLTGAKTTIIAATHDSRLIEACTARIDLDSAVRSVPSDDKTESSDAP